MKTKKLFLLALTALCSLGVWGAYTSEWDGWAQRETLPAANTPSTKNNITLTSSIAPATGWLWGTLCNAYNPEGVDGFHIDITTADAAQLEFTDVMIEIRYEASVENTVYIQFYTSASIDDTKKNGSPVVMNADGQNYLGTWGQVPSGSRSARIYRTATTYGPWFYGFHVTTQTISTVFHKVHYLAGEGTGTMADGEVGENKSFKLPQPEGLSYANHRFTKWSDGTNLYAVGADYQMGTSDLTFTAQWEEFVPKFVDATWRYDGTNVLPSQTSSTVNEITLTSNFATNSASWLFGCNPLVYNYEHCGNDNALDITLTEGLVIKNVTTSINFLNGTGVGNVLIQYCSAKQYDATKLLGNPIALTGASDNSSETPCSNDAPAGAQSARIYGSVGWGPHLYSITVSAGPSVEVNHTIHYSAGEGEGTMPDVTMAYTKKFNLPQPQGLTYAGHNFAGWSDGEDTYQPGDSYTMPDNDVTFTAQWKEYPSIPCTLPIADAITAGEEWKKEDGWVKRLDKKSTSGSVTWMVLASKAGEYTVSVNTSCDNTANLTITVYNSDDESISNLTTVTGWQISGVKSLGSVQIPSTGSYRVVATSATEYSHIWFNTLKFEFVPPVPSASFAVASKDIYIGDTYNQTVTTESTGTVTYSSNKTNVATVDATTGEVTGIAVGTATITATIAATTDFKSTTATYLVSVQEAPVAGRKYYIDPGADKLYNVIQNAQENDTVVFRDGTYTEAYSRTFAKMITLMADEGAHPVINTVSYLKATKGMTIDGIDVNSTHSSYAVVLNGGSSDDMILRNMKISAPNAYEGIETTSGMNRLIIDNCVISAKTYGIHFNQAANMVSIKNTTFTSATYAALYISGSNAIPTTIDHCTFYNNPNGGNYVVHLQGFNGSQTTISNSVLYNTPATSGYGIVGSSNKPAVINCLINNITTATYSTTNTNLLTSDPMLVVEDGQYYYQAGSPIIGAATDGSNLGDPRWKLQSTTITISDQATDNSVLVANEGKTVDVQLERSLAGGMYNTICLPFDLSAEQIAASDWAGAKIIALSSTTLEDGKLYLNYEEADAIEAGKGYLIQPLTDVADPSFEDVTITKTEATVETIDDVEVRPTFIISQIEASPMNLYLYQNNTLYYPNNQLQIDGLRLYYHVNGSAQIPARMRIIGRGTATELGEIEQMDTVRKYIQDGRLYIIRNGVEYNAQGQIVK